MEDENAQPTKVWRLNLFENIEENDYSSKLQNEWFNSNTPQKP